MKAAFTLIVAATHTNGIGISSRGLPWRLPGEMAYFVRMTSGAPSEKTNAVIMGRKSWESIPAKFRPLKNRFNIVISSQKGYDLGTVTDKTVIETSIENGLELVRSQSAFALHRAFIIGGATLYKQSMDLPDVDRILLTRLLEPDFDECDVFLPEFRDESSRWKQASHQELVTWAGWDVPAGIIEEKGVKYEFQMWIR